MSIFTVLRYPIDYPYPTDEQVEALPYPLYDKWLKEMYPGWNASHWAAGLGNVDDKVSLLRKLMLEYEE